MPWFPVLPMLHFFALILYLFLIMYLLTANLKSTMTISAVGLFVCLSFWSGGMIFIHNPLTPENIISTIYIIYAFGWIFFPPFALWLMLEISGLKKPYLNPSTLLPLFLPAPIFAAAHICGLLINRPVRLDFGWFAEWKEGVWTSLYYIYYFFCTVAGAAALFLSARKAKYNVIRAQRLVIASAVVVVLLIGTFIEVILPRIKSPSGFMGDITDLFIIILAFAVIFSIRYLKLFDLSLSPAEKEIISNMNGFFILLDNEFEISYVNRQVLDFTGYREDELIGKPFSFLTGTQPGLDNFHDAIIEKGSFKSQDFYLSRADRGVIPVMITASSLNEMGELKSVICVANDITEIKKTQDALRESNEKLMELDALKTRFASMISHDIRTPLTAIISFAYLLRRESASGFSPKQEEYIESIHSNSERLLTLTNDLMDLSKMESGSYKLHKQPSKISDTITLSSFNMMSLFQSRDVSFRFTPPQPEIILDMDPDRMSQVITNLLANAVKFSNPGSEITVSAAAEKNSAIRVPVWAHAQLSVPAYVVISVIDRGTGIDRNNLEKIFDRFYQVEAESAARTVGTGLGLNIVKSIVELHDGFVWAESEGIGKGTTIKVLLPYNTAL
jgi:PAS domain S-box-containing protein